jgi:hypothetical protein
MPRGVLLGDRGSNIGSGHHRQNRSGGQGSQSRERGTLVPTTWALFPCRAELGGATIEAVVGGPSGVRRFEARRQTMRVLVIEGSPGAATSAVETLQAAGHETTSCHHDGSTFPCNGLAEDRRCPLEDGAPIDVALLVRDVPEPRPDGERGRRALRAASPHPARGRGGDRGQSLRELCRDLVDRPRQVVALAEHAASRPLAAHAGVARTALQTLLAARTSTRLVPTPS